jgi:hypothetical protein
MQIKININFRLFLGLHVSEATRQTTQLFFYWMKADK